MKAVVFHEVGNIRLDDVLEPSLQEPTDASFCQEARSAKPGNR
jgi:hypothetical protein